MLEKIEKDITKRMSHYTDSRQVTDDEVTIAWLVSEVNRLKEHKDTLILQLANIRNDITNILNG